MRCKTCLRVYRCNDGFTQIHWQNGQCGACYYNGKHGRKTDEIRGSPRRGTMKKSHRLMDLATRHNRKITEKNVDSYVKLKEIVCGIKIDRDHALYGATRHQKLVIKQDFSF